MLLFGGVPLFDYQAGRLQLLEILSRSEQYCKNGVAEKRVSHYFLGRSAFLQLRGQGVLDLFHVEQFSLCLEVGSQ